MKFEECGNYLLFLWMENLLTDSEYYKAIDRFNKRVMDEQKQKNCR